MLIVTWWKTFQLKREANRLRMETPLVTLLLRDGTFYFLILLILNVLQMLNFFISLSDLDFSFMVTTFTAIIVSHFILNLREADTRTLTLTTPSFIGADTHDLSFAAGVVGNMGAEVDGSFGLASVRTGGSEWSGSSGYGEDEVEGAGEGVEMEFPERERQCGEEKEAEVVEVPVPASELHA